MIKNRKMTEWLCKNCLPKGKTKVCVGHVVGLGILYAVVIGALLLIGGFIARIIGELVCAIILDLNGVLDLNDVFMGNARLTSYVIVHYTDFEIMVYGIGAMVCAFVFMLIVDKIFNMEIAECPLHKGDDETEE